MTSVTVQRQIKPEDHPAKGEYANALTNSTQKGGS